MNTIEIINLNYSVIDGNSKRKILDNLNIKVENGKVIVIFGPSGSGKTTLLYALAGILDNIDSGEILVNSESIYKMKQNERDEFRLHNMGLVFQNLNLFPYMSVTENILIPIYAKNLKPCVNDQKRLMELISLLGVEDCIGKPIGKLSGGEQQRIAIIRAFISKPAVVICDEPTANLDRKNSIIFYEKLRSIAEIEGCSVVMVSHDALARKYSDYAIELVDGKIENDSLTD